MKKIISLFLAVLVVFSVAVTAFAADIYTCPTCGKKYETLTAYNACIASHETTETEEPTIYTCEFCQKKYYTLDEYNNCIDEHRNSVEYKYNTYIGISVPELLSKIVTFFSSLSFLDIAKELGEKVISYAESFIPSLIGE